MSLFVGLPCALAFKNTQKLGIFLAYQAAGDRRIKECSMWYLRILALSLLIFACGKDNSSKPLWSQEQINTESGNCVASAIKGNETDQDLKRKATAFCNCYYNTLSFRVAYATYKSNESTYTDELTKDGTEQKCIDEGKRSLY